MKNQDSKYLKHPAVKKLINTLKAQEKIPLSFPSWRGNYINSRYTDDVIKLFYVFSPGVDKSIMLTGGWETPKKAWEVFQKQCEKSGGYKPDNVPDYDTIIQDLEINRNMRKRYQ